MSSSDPTPLELLADVAGVGRQWLREYVRAEVAWRRLTAPGFAGKKRVNSGVPETVSSLPGSAIVKAVTPATERVWLNEAETVAAVGADYWPNG